MSVYNQNIVSQSLINASELVRAGSRLLEEEHQKIDTLQMQKHKELSAY